MPKGPAIPDNLSDAELQRLAAAQDVPYTDAGYLGFLGLTPAAVGEYQAKHPEASYQEAIDALRTRRF